MKQLFNALKIAGQANRLNSSLLNYVPKRGARYETNITWKAPEKYRHYESIRTGDTEKLTIKDPLEVYFEFRDSKELETADDKVKKVFSLGYFKYRQVYEHYRNELLEKVKEHPFDESTSVKIARKTAVIRHFQHQISLKPSRSSFFKKQLDNLVGKRKKLLKQLRAEDYKKFEWLLETLNLEFKPGLPVECRKVTRKNAILLLARLKAEKIKEEKLGELKRKLDSEKIPFLEKKMATLKLIREKEEKAGLEPSVTDEDIAKCAEKLEKVKVELKENERIGYVRKIHPYFIEPYYESLLKEKEESGQILREQLESKQQNESSNDTAA